MVVETVAPQLIAGTLLLAFGRRLYLLLLAIVGFSLGLALTASLGLSGPAWLPFAVGLCVGLFCALLTFLLQKIVLGLAGFAVGLLVALWVMDFYALALGPWQWLIALLAAVLSALAMQSIFHAALVVLTSVVGASLLVDASGFRQAPALALFLVLLSTGVALQARSLASARDQRGG